MTQVVADWLHSKGTQDLFRLFGDAGFQLFAVGGCVRNSLLGAPVADIDMATDAQPDQVMTLAQNAGLKTIPTGIDHGTITVMVGDEPYEITTFRTDIDTDGRHATVAYALDWQEDARRRDFTMNALYADASGTVQDCVGGIADLNAGVLRFIGAPEERIEEDYLRILRFFRFSAWYGRPENGIDAEGLSACAMLAEGLKSLSRERVGAEMRKLLGAPDPAPAVASMAQSGVLMRVMPGAEPAALTVLVHLEAGQTPDWMRRALVLGGEDVSETWRLSRKEARTLAQARADLGSQTPVLEMAYRHGAQHARNVALVMAASLQQLVATDLDEQIAKARHAVLPIKATDLMPKLSGPALGKKLEMLEAEWIASGFQLTRAELLIR